VTPVGAVHVVEDKNVSTTVTVTELPALALKLLNNAKA
jgi:hypothetical protein